jgi:4-amino-4-deoxy-L-arabinose transferase-like glycosyltransferase
MKKYLLLILIFIFSFIIRIYRIDSIPPHLYWDEASIGFNAYTISQNMRDEHGLFMPIAKFSAFGDNKPPGYIYVASIFVRIFGKNEFSVRFPSFLSGVLYVFTTYLLTNLLFKKKKIALLAAYFIGASCWSIHFSRAAFEAHLAAYYNLLAIYFFIKSFLNKKFIIFSFVFFVLSFYTFNSNRISAPLILLFLLIYYRQKISKNLKYLVISIIISILLILPSLNYLFSSESKLRLQEVSIYNNLEILKRSNSRIEHDGSSIFAKIIHNRRLEYFKDYLKHYTDNFSLRFLFTHGDVNPRLAVRGMGQLYIWDLLFLIFGIIILIKKSYKNAIFLLSWMLITVIPAGIAKETPHSLRIISILPTYQIIIAFGFYNLYSYFRYHKINRYFTVTSIVLLIINFYYFLHIYFIHFPMDWSSAWQYGYKEMVNYVMDNYQKYDQIFVTRELGRPYIYFAFYSNFKLDEYYKKILLNRDIYGFYNDQSLGNIKFGFDDLLYTKGKILLVSNQRDYRSDFQILKIIKNLKGEEIFYISEKI